MRDHNKINVCHDHAQNTEAQNSRPTVAVRKLHRESADMDVMRVCERDILHPTTQWSGN